MSTIVSTPYRENSIGAIAQAAVERHQLHSFLTSLNLGPVRIAIDRRVPVISRLTRQLARREFEGIPRQRIRGLVPMSELLHLSVRRIVGDRTPSVTTPLMYWVKARFDSVMAKALRPSEGEVLVGMYGSCRDSFERATELGMFKVLHFVNSIPTAHNEYLRELAGVSSSHHEMIPNWMAERVHDEVNLADLILTPSQFVARQFSQIQGSQKKVVVIPYGVNLGKFRSPETRPRRSRIRCLYVGQISYRKGIQDLLAAARRLSKLPIDFEVLGPVVSRELLLQFPENVRYGGSQLAGGVAMAMQESDVFVLPSYEDACALVTLEAMASGMPVVTTTHNGASELITHQIDGFVIDPGDPSRLADQLAELLDPQIRSDVGARAAAKARESLSWGAYGHAVMETIVRRRTRALG